MPVDVNKLATLGQLGNLAERTVQAIAPTFKSLAVAGNRVNFYTSANATGDPAFYFDFAEEVALDLTDTQLVQNFAWNAQAYPDSTNPNLDGETVLVLVVKGDKQTNPTTSYKFISMAALMSGGTGKVDKVTGATAGNIPVLTSDGGITNSTYGIATNAECDELLQAILPTVQAGGGD